MNKANLKLSREPATQRTCHASGGRSNQLPQSKTERALTADLNGLECTIKRQ